jgi:hypothetical protein
MALGFSPDSSDSVAPTGFGGSEDDGDDSSLPVIASFSIKAVALAALVGFVVFGGDA